MTENHVGIEELGVPPGRPPLQERANSWLAITSLVAGILSILIWLALGALADIGFGLVAATVGLTASNQITRSRDTQKGQTAAVVGLVLGLVGVVGGIVALGAWGWQPGYRVLLDAFGR